MLDREWIFCKNNIFITVIGMFHRDVFSYFILQPILLRVCFVLSAVWDGSHGFWCLK